MTVELTLQWTPIHGSPRKFVFEPQPDGEYPWARIEYERRALQWREVGIEHLREISITTGGDTEPDRCCAHEGNNEDEGAADE